MWTNRGEFLPSPTRSIVIAPGPMLLHTFEYTDPGDVYDDLVKSWRALNILLGIKFGYNMVSDPKLGNGIAGIKVNMRSKEQFLNAVPSIVAAVTKFTQSHERRVCNELKKLAEIEAKYPGESETFKFGMFAATKCMHCGYGAYCTKTALGKHDAIGLTDRNVAQLVAFAQFVFRTDDRAAKFVRRMLKRYDLDDKRLFNALNTTRCMKTGALIGDLFGQFGTAKDVLKWVLWGCCDCRPRMQCLRLVMDNAGVDTARVARLIRLVWRFGRLATAFKRRKHKTAAAEIYHTMQKQIIDNRSVV